MFTDSSRTLPCLASLRASGSSSAKTIHSMQPAAKPSARGRSWKKLSTNRKLGSATSGWGAAVNSVHQKALLALMPLATSTVATARPSGMLCSPMASVTSSPCITGGFEARFGRGAAVNILSQSALCALVLSGRSHDANDR